MGRWLEKVSTKKVQLIAHAKDSEMGLNANEPYYPVTSADAVIGLKKEIGKQMITYRLATEAKDGLLSKEDKNKIDQIRTGPEERLQLQSPDGSVFNLTINNDGQINVTKGGIKNK